MTKHIFFSILFILCVWIWFYAPFPFESMLLSLTPETRPLVFFLLGYVQIRVVYDLGTMVYDAYFYKD